MILEMRFVDGSVRTFCSEWEISDDGDPVVTQLVFLKDCAEGNHIGLWHELTYTGANRFKIYHENVLINFKYVMTMISLEGTIDNE